MTLLARVRVHSPHMSDGDAEEIRTLVHTGADQQTAVAAALHDNSANKTTQWRLSISTVSQTQIL